MVPLIEYLMYNSKRAFSHNYRVCQNKYTVPAASSGRILCSPEWTGRTGGSRRQFSGDGETSSKKKEKVKINNNETALVKDLKYELKDIERYWKKICKTILRDFNTSSRKENQ